MAFKWLNLTTPFFWCFIGASFFGAGVARASRPSLGTGRWTRVYLCLSLSVAAAAAGVFVPGPRQFLDLQLVYFSAAVASISFLSFRYKATIGTAVVLLAAILISLVGISLRGWQPLEGSAVNVARLHVLGSTKSVVNLEVTPQLGPAQRTPYTGSLPSGEIAAVVETLSFSKDYFFLSSPYLYRLDAVVARTKVGSDRSNSQTGSRELSVLGQGSVGVPVAEYLPGVVYRKVVGGSLQPKTLEDYVVRLERDLTIDFVPGSP